MLEKTFILDNIEPQLFYGIKDNHLKEIKKSFPKLKIIARGSEIKVSGDQNELTLFEEKMNLINQYIEKKGTLTEQCIYDIFDNNAPLTANKVENMPKNDDILVYGNNGLIIKARTDNQKVMVKSIDHNDILFAIGPAGTGKTYTAVALAVRALKNKEIKRIILTRPAVEAGEHLGFLPGDLKEKIDPYLRPLYDALEDMIPIEKLKLYLETRIIEVAPMAFMRGRTLDNCYVILDESQNSTDMQIKMFLTRMGPSAKVIITGDLTQIDLPKKSMSGLAKAIRILDKIKGIGIVHLTTEDVVRHKLVKEIIKAYEKEHVD